MYEQVRKNLMMNKIWTKTEMYLKKLLVAYRTIKGACRSIDSEDMFFHPNVPPQNVPPYNVSK